MSDGNVDLAKDHQALAYSMPLDQINPAQPQLFKDDLVQSRETDRFLHRFFYLFFVRWIIGSAFAHIDVDQHAVHAVLRILADI